MNDIRVFLIATWFPPKLPFIVLFLEFEVCVMGLLLSHSPNPAEKFSASPLPNVTVICPWERVLFVTVIPQVNKAFYETEKLLCSQAFVSCFDLDFYTSCISVSNSVHSEGHTLILICFIAIANFLPLWNCGYAAFGVRGIHKFTRQCWLLNKVIMLGNENKWIFASFVPVLDWKPPQISILL